jgi:predicted transcriptional regulator of viral defense system
MKYYEQLVQLGCFTKNDVEQLTGNSGTAYSLLQNYKKNGYIEQVKRNLYVAISLETKQSVATRFQIASHIKSDSYVTHHSAFEYYGCANQVFCEVYVASRSKFSAFSYDYVAYRYIASRIDCGVVQGSDGVRITDPERTVVDSLNDFDRVSGLEEFLRCLDLVPLLDEKKLLYYLEKYDKQFLFQKAGYLLGHFQGAFQLSDAFYSVCEKNTEKSVRYFYRGMENESSVYDRRWRLFVPKNLMSIISKGGSADEEI